LFFISANEQWASLNLVQASWQEVIFGAENVFQAHSESYLQNAANLIASFAQPF
jgi:hypothetical protein